MPTFHTNRVFLLLLGAVTFLLCVFAHFILLQGVPHVVDETSYLLQADLFSDNRRTGPAFALAELFGLPYWSAEPRSYSVFPFGWPLLLSVGTRFGFPDLVNPLCAAFLPWLTYAIARPLRPAREARIAASIVALSPGIWILGGSYMPHTSCLLACMGLWVSLRSDRPLWAIPCFAYVLWARPFEGILFGLPLSVWASQGRHTTHFGLWLGYAVAVLCVLLDNYQITGSALTFPMNAWFEELAGNGRVPSGCNALGFGSNIGCISTLGSFGHTPTKALQIAANSLFRLDHFLLGTTGGTALIAVGLYRWKSGLPYALALLYPIACYALYWSPGTAYGARFYHSLYVFLPMLVAAGLSILPRFWPYVLIVGCSIAGGSSIAKDLQNNYLCVTGELVSIVRTSAVRGTIFLDITDRYVASWPTLGTVDHTCSASGIITAVAAENSAQQLIRQLPKDSRLIQQAPGPHYVLRQRQDSAAELLQISDVQ